ncbi:MAG: hypothetical protein K8T25_22425 [Planctomycetia bacterium]|nr:hypothetical protein [Planctomycetia bacterium]
MKKTMFSLTIAAAATLLPAQLADARGFGGSSPHGGSAGGGSSYHGSSGGGGSSFHGSSGGSREGGSSGGYGGNNRNNNSQHSDAEGAAAGHAYTDRNQPQHSGAEGAAAGSAATKRNEPQYSGAEGAAAGAAATKHNEPQYSGAEGAAAGAAVANRNQPQFSGAEGAAAGAAVANNNQPQYSGAAGAAAGYAVGQQNSYGAAVAHVGLPTDAGYGFPAGGAGAAAYVSNHRTAPVNASVVAARGAATRSSFGDYGMYGRDWYGAHPGAWVATGWPAGAAWGTATWGGVAPAIGIAATVQPIPYNYGSNVSYQDNQVYYGNQPVATADQYYQQAATLAQSAPAADPQADDWMPLGVFGLVQNDQADPHFIMQIAMNKQGVIGGNYSDVVSGTNMPIQGAVDKKSQRVAWTVGGNKNTVGETGLYNLTQDEAPALIHVGKDKTQQWLLVRLKQPAQAPAQ